MQRDADDRFDTLEAAVTFGVANVVTPGFAATRQKDRKRTVEPATPNDGAWAAQLARDFPGNVAVRSGDGPMPS